MGAFAVLSSYGTALFKGDPVRLASTPAMDATSELPAIEAAATGNVILGVIEGFLPGGAATVLTGNYNPASTARVALVNIDPDSVYAVQEDAVGGSVSAANVGDMKNADIIVAAGSTVTGLSGVMLDSNTVAATGEDLKIVGVLRNGGANYAALSGGAILEVMILSPAMKATDSNS
jgi:hypothetical protein